MAIAKPLTNLTHEQNIEGEAVHLDLGYSPKV